MQTKTESREEREQQLRQLWKTKQGQIQLLSYYWEIRPQKSPMQAGESVFGAILDYEFGPQPTPQTVPHSDESELDSPRNSTLANA